MENNFPLFVISCLASMLLWRSIFGSSRCLKIRLTRIFMRPRPAIIGSRTFLRPISRFLSRRSFRPKSNRWKCGTKIGRKPLLRFPSRIVRNSLDLSILIYRRGGKTALKRPFEIAFFKKNPFDRNRFAYLIIRFFNTIALSLFLGSCCWQDKSELRCARNRKSKSWILTRNQTRGWWTWLLNLRSTHNYK